MKLAFFITIILSIVFILISLPQEGFACGTVKDWVNIYFNPQHTDQDKALYWVHCEPILDSYYDATIPQHQLLAKMIDHALDSNKECDHNFAIKNFLLFDQLYWIKDTDIHKNIVAKIERLLQRPINNITGSLSFYNIEEDYEPYCQKVKLEVSEMRTGNVRCSGRCRKIDISEIQTKFQIIKNFINTTDSCLNRSTEDYLDVEVLRIKSKLLNLRSHPNRTSPILRILNNGDILRVLISKEDGWIKVLNEDCLEGWVAGYLTIDGRSLTNAQASTVECSINFDCPKGFFCKKTIGDCDGIGTCLIKPDPLKCPKLADPHCGCDGKTYTNECLAAADGMSIKSSGKCPSKLGDGD